ncbi:DUF7519 family protein [Halomontanus rarus]|uniref:DUF7519 family protein n=1 Tax=Halomontanus rarus TaxID=3034020 RepID=UPI00293BD168|nr:hypothetical protein [Halovivax sp. KZCA124]
MSTQREELTVVDVDHAPTAVSSTAAIIAAVVAAITSAPFALLALPLGIGGAGIVAAGLRLGGKREWVTLGAGALFLSILVAGGFGTPVEFLLVSTISTLLAWDFGQNAISLGEQIGRHSRTKRNEVIHASASLVVALLSSAFGYLVYTNAGSGRPVASLTMLVLGVVLLIWAIRT